MNKLVSKNPILRFKEGKKIIKMLEGNQFIYYTGRDGKNYEAWRGGNDWYYREKGKTGMTRMPYDYVTTTGKKFYGTDSRGGAIANSYNVVNNMKNTPNYTPSSNTNNAVDNLLKTGKYILDLNGNVRKISNMLSSNIKVNGMSLEDKRKQYSQQKSVSNQPTLQKTSSLRSGWSYGYGPKEGITDIAETQRMLKEGGFYDLDYINSGVKVDDGKWGKNTEAAYQRYLLSKLSSSIPPITYTPGKMNNGVFTASGLPTTDINVAMLSLLPPKPKTISPGTFNLLANELDPYTRKEIRNMRNDYSTVDLYWDYLNNNNNRDTADFKLWSNIMRTTDGNLNRLAFDQIMNKYGIRGNLGRRDSGRLANLLNTLSEIGTEGSDARNAFIDSHNNSLALKLEWMLVRKQGGQLVSKNIVERFKANFR